MKALLVGAHPNPFSFNAAVRTALANELNSAGHEVRSKDLYEERFQPVLFGEEVFNSFQGAESPKDVTREQEDVSWAELICFIYPTWWMGMPSVLKGYIDRVFSYNYAYSYSETGSIGMLKGKKAIIIQTAGRSERNLKDSGLEHAMKLITKEGIFEFCGIEVVEHTFLYRINSINENARIELLDQVAGIINKLK